MKKVLLLCSVVVASLILNSAMADAKADANAYVESKRMPQPPASSESIAKAEQGAQHVSA